MRRDVAPFCQYKGQVLRDFIMEMATNYGFDINANPNIDMLGNLVRANNVHFQSSIRTGRRKKLCNRQRQNGSVLNITPHTLDSTSEHA